MEASQIAEDVSNKRDMDLQRQVSRMEKTHVQNITLYDTQILNLSIDHAK